MFRFRKKEKQDKQEEQHIDYKLKLTIRAIMMYEQMTGNSFQDFQSSEENSLPLLYCMIVANNDYRETYEVCCNTLFSDEEILPRLGNILQREILFTTQFPVRIKTPVEPEDEEEKKEEGKDEETEESKLFLHQFIPVLVRDCGLDINYILDSMPYKDIDMYVEYKTNKDKERLMEKRMWTYLQIIPHINTKKCKEKDLIEFPWEKAQRKKEAEEEIRRNKNKLHSFMSSGPLKDDKKGKIVEDVTPEIPKRKRTRKNKEDKEE